MQQLGALGFNSVAGGSLPSPCPPQVSAKMAFYYLIFQAEAKRLVPEQFEALGLDTDAGGRQAIHKLQAWASAWELDAVREQDKEVAAMHNRAEQFDPSAEAIFIPFQVCCVVTEQGNLLGRPPWGVCVGQSNGCTAHQCRALRIPTLRLVSSCFRCVQGDRELLSVQLT